MSHSRAWTLGTHPIGSAAAEPSVCLLMCSLPLRAALLRLGSIPLTPAPPPAQLALSPHSPHRQLRPVALSRREHDQHHQAARATKTVAQGQCTNANGATLTRVLFGEARWEHADADCDCAVESKCVVALCDRPQDEQCHRLVRLLMRAYYEKEHVAIVDCLLDMQVKQANK